MKPLIAITVGEVINESERWVPPIHGQSHTYSDAVIHAGGAPFALPITNDEEVLRRLYDQCNGLLLTGGVDIDPMVCGASCPPSKAGKPCRVHDRPFLPRRDHQEIQLLKWALADNKPVLGICRGMQLINAALGGSLHHDINGDLPAAHNHEANIHKKNFNYLAHRLRVDSSSKLAAILGTDTIKANTLHHQAVKRLGNGLIATAHTEDGVIEAIELPDKLFLIGVQSHPEALEAKVEPLWRELFKAFVDSAADSISREEFYVRAAV